MDDLLLLGPDTATLPGWRDAIAAYCRDRLRLALHPDKEQLSKVGQGIEYLGYRVYPHHLHAGSRSVKALKEPGWIFSSTCSGRNAFRFARSRCAASGKAWRETATLCRLTPSWALLKRMEATINCYYGIMGHAQPCKLRKTLCHKHFWPLRSFFVPADAGYTAVHAVKRFLHQ